MFADISYTWSSHEVKNKQTHKLSLSLSLSSTIRKVPHGEEARNRQSEAHDTSWNRYSISFQKKMMKA